MYTSVRFGSRIKGASDKYSDNDLLIICNDKERKLISEILKNEGYNISFFSEKQLNWMKKKGSLFLQHIKRDGVIMHDRGDYLQNFLSECNFIPPSSDELKRCESTLSFIISLPEEPLLVGWEADFLYCSTRDYLIKKLASIKILAFGLDEIILKSIEYFGFTEQDFNNLRTLREIKSINRNEFAGSFNNKKASFTINTWKDILNSKLGIDTNKKTVEIKNLLLREDYNSTYEALRCLEGLHILLENKGIYHLDNDKILKYITSPNLYKSLQLSKKETIKRYTYEIHSLL